MQSKPSISVIIPVYNAAPFVGQCVRSVMSFPFVQEIILIDDGSTDGSGEICDQLVVSSPSLIRVLHQANRGVSAARNLGICVAHCQWLWFVDADDYVLPVAQEHCLLPEDSQFVLTGYVWDEYGKATACGAKATDIPYNLWRCWFLRRKVNEYGLFFTEGRKYAEDQEFILRYLLAVGRDKASSIADACYYYTLRQGSAMTRLGKKWKHIGDLISVSGVVLKKAFGHKKLAERWLWREIRRLARNILEIIKNK